MTIGKTLTRALCLCLLCILLMSCSQEADYPFDTLIAPEETQADDSAVSRYRVVIAFDCTPELLSAAQAFATRLTETLTVPAEVVYDRQADLPGENVMEIVLGAADRTGIGTAMGNMRKDDYLCRMIEGRLVIGGIHDTATLTALDRFCQEILPGATATSLMHPDGGFSHVGTYPKGQVLLNGFDLSEYCLLLPDSAPMALRALAASLRDRIGQESGYWLRIESPSSHDGVRKTVALRLAAGDGLAHVEPEERGIALSANDLFGVSVAVREFYGALLANETDGICDCRVTTPLAVAYRQNSYEIATVLGDYWLPFETHSVVRELTGPVLETEADAVLFGAVTQEDRDYLSPNLSGYTPVEAEQSGERVLPLYEKTDCMSLLDCEIDTLSYAVVRIGSEADGFLLVHISGSVTTNQSVTLPQSVREAGLPVVVVTQIAGEGGVLSFDDATYLGYELSFVRDYAFGEHPYAFACYATAGAFQITPDTVNARGGCVSFHVKRNSVF